MRRALNFVEAAQLATTTMLAKHVFAEVRRVKGGWRVVAGEKPIVATAWSRFWISVSDSIRGCGDSRLFFAKLYELADAGDKTAIAAVADIDRFGPKTLYTNSTIFEKGSVHYYRGFDAPPCLETHVGNYTEDWSSISTKLREDAHWRCSRCGLDLGFKRYLLHVHHLDFNRQNNSKNNLIVVCALCHSRFPGHGHLLDGLASADIRFLELG